MARRKSLANIAASADLICARIDCAKSFTRSPADKRIGSRKDPSIEYCSVKCRTRVNQRILNGVVSPRTKQSSSLPKFPKKAKSLINQPVKQVITIKCECVGCTTPKNTIDVVISPNKSSGGEKTITRVPSGWMVEVCGEDYVVMCDVCINSIESVDPEAASFRNTSATATAIQDTENVVVLDREYSTCPQCARPFIKTYGLMVYCGRQCSKDAAVRIRKKSRSSRAANVRQLLVKKCAFDRCCKDFETHDPRKKYCSRKCSWRNVWERQKAITKNIHKGFVDPMMGVPNDAVFYSGDMGQ